MYELGKKDITKKELQNILDHKVSTIQDKAFDSCRFDELLKNKQNEKKDKQSEDDQIAITHIEFVHCSFSNVSFKEVLLKFLKFENCTFFNCYFSNSKINNCSFIGCRFINCNFRKAMWSFNEFKYLTFQGCFIEYKYMIQNLPQEPDISREMCNNLRVEASKLGKTEDALKYKLKKIAFDEEHLKNIIMVADEWYAGHFNWWDIFKSILKLLRSKINGLTWGYGENFKNLFFSFIFFMTLFFLALFYLDSNGSIDFLNLLNLACDTLKKSFQNILSMKRDFNSDAHAWLFIIQKAISMLFLALLISLFTRRILKK